MKDVFAPGEEFRGYEIVKRAGEGGLGTVWVARHKTLDTLFAVKILDPETAESKPEYVTRFLREAKLATKIRHPNLVSVYDAGRDEKKGVYFLVMDYVEGDTLRTAIALGGPQGEKEAVGTILRIADVLSVAQRYGMVHRDLKPENVMISRDGEVKLLDLGVAKASGGFDSLKTVAQSVFGTPSYISPEQAVDSSSVDARADVYSLGVMLFELLSGRRPYEGDTPAEILAGLLSPDPVPDVREFAPGVSDAVASIVARMCAKDRESRIASPGDAIEAFAEAGFGLDGGAGRAARAPEPVGDMAELLAGVGCAGGDGDGEAPRKKGFWGRIAAMLKKTKPAVLAIASAALASLCAAAETVATSDCERDPSLDIWASNDVAFAKMVMADVFARAGLERERLPFGSDGMFDARRTDVICSAFRTSELLENFDFPLQPIARMHFGLYTTPERSKKMLSVKITDWPRMRVGYSPVSQGSNADRERYFRHATLTPEYVEFRRSKDAVDALKTGDVDILFLYTPDGRRPEDLVEIVPIGTRNVYFAVRKSRPDLLRRLESAYRECYIDNIDKYDEYRERLLGVKKPAKRVRVAAYRRGHLFDVMPDGERKGVVEDWIKAIAPIAHWDIDYVYGNYDESLGDVTAGRLDVVGGIGFSASRGEKFLYPHTPIGMLRVYLWAKKGSRFVAGDPSSWHGMHIGLLAGALSAQRVKQQLEDNPLDVELREYATDGELTRAYFAGEVDACVNIEMPALDRENALHIYASHPMYLCTSPSRRDLFLELEKALDGVCDNFPKYMKMITERHYGIRSEMSVLTLKEAKWLKERLANPEPVYVDFSPWPVELKDKKGRVCGFAASLLSEISARTGLKMDVQHQTGIQTAEAKFLRGDTQFWIPYPEKYDPSSAGGVSVFSLPVPKSYATFIGSAGGNDELEMWAGRNVPEELVNIIRKAVSAIEPMELQEMFIKAVAERTMEQRVFGMTAEELRDASLAAGFAVLALVAVFAAVMAFFLKREAGRAKAAARRAEEYSRAKTRFLAMMSHELRTPLNAVIGFAEFLSRPDCDAQRQREYINGIQLSATALLDLINDILDLSKLDSGAMHMKSGECNVDKLVEELPAIFGYHVRTAGVKLSVGREGGRAIPIVKLSQHGVRQILINLVGNSAKFTESGEISAMFGWEPETKTLRITVKDTGCGISEEKMAHLFDPFVQDIASRMKHGDGVQRGTGLGLPIVKRMIDTAGGSVEVRSELGKGTVFDISFPGLEVVREAPAAPAAPAGRVPRGALVVDDMSINRRILGIHLANLGVEDVRYAENGKAALAQMAEWIPQVVLTDLWMPEMDGQQLAEAMRADARLAGVPVFAITADVDASSTYDMSVFSKVVAKPITSDKLKRLFE